VHCKPACGNREKRGLTTERGEACEGAERRDTLCGVMPALDSSFLRSWISFSSSRFSFVTLFVS
jgi:hypothetical protein